MWHHLVLAILVHFTFVDCTIFTAVPNAFFKDCLLEINKYRKLHGAYPLRWSDDLQYHAQLRAEKLVEDEFLQTDLETLNRLGQGETVSYLSPPKELCRTFPPSGDCYACRDTVASWYNESIFYNYNTGYSLDGTKPVLHFTQLVWKDTVKVGLATALSPLHGIITVARYHPRGNIGFLDDYVRNVARKVPGGGDRFDGNEGDGSQGGPPCRKLKKRKAKKVSLDCFNEYKDELCDSYARIPGYCSDYDAFMNASCAKSCGVCKPDVPLRFPAPPVIGRKTLKFYWQIGKWLECHGGFQLRSLNCFYKDNGRVYLVRNHFCKHELGEEPPKYKDCNLLS